MKLLGTILVNCKKWYVMFLLAIYNWIQGRGWEHSTCYSPPLLYLNTNSKTLFASVKALYDVREVSSTTLKFLDF